MSVAKTKPLRVALLLEDLSIGGTQRQTVEMARLLNPEHVDAQLWIMLQGDHFAPLAQQWGLSVQWLTRSDVLGPKGIYALWRKIRTERPDILVLLTALPNIWGRILGRVAGVPVIIANIRQSGAPKRYHERFLKSLANHHICNAHSLKKILTRDYAIPEQRVTTIHNGVDVERFQPVEKENNAPPKLMSAARLVADKDQLTLLRAFEIVANKHPEVQLHLYGNGPLKQELRDKADSMPETTAKRFFIHKGRDKMEQVYPLTDIFVLSSLREGLPNVVLEAMASGIPVVSTSIDGVPEIVEHGVNGLLVNPGDHEEMARCIIQLLEDADMRNAMGKAGRNKAVEHFTYENSAKAHESLFMKLAEEKK